MIVISLKELNEDKIRYINQKKVILELRLNFFKDLSFFIEAFIPKIKVEKISSLMVLGETRDLKLLVILPTSVLCRFNSPTDTLRGNLKGKNPLFSSKSQLRSSSCQRFQKAHHPTKLDNYTTTPP